jgi:UDP-N-acetylmuramate--alanine ligase
MPRPDVRATDVRYGGSARLSLVVDGMRAGESRLAFRARSTCSTRCRRLRSGSNSGSRSTIAQALGGFRGVRRRFEFVARTPRMTVVDDYAHHPTAVAATIAAARADFDGPIVAAFQPHRYTRTQYLGGRLRARVARRRSGRADRRLRGFGAPCRRRRDRDRRRRWRRSAATVRT